MSELRLRPGVNFAPAGHPFVDPKTGFKVDAYERGISGAVDILIGHRKANPRTFNPNEYQHFSPSLVKQELLRHLHSKAPQLFKGEPVPAVARTETGFPSKCPNCSGTAFSPQWCPTCGSGQRQIGFICDGCKKTFPL